MNKAFNDSQFSDSVKLSNFNQAGLQQAEQNYFMKYANSGFSDINNTQRGVKRTETKVLSPNPNGFSKVKNAQNQVLRQLKQEYQILRNLPIDEKGDNIKSKSRRQPPSQYSSQLEDGSEFTSSKRSERRKGGRDAQILALQKKQLQIVISNSLKKIEQLLQNQMELKKIIHELKLQIQGKGGINSEYQLQIKSFRKKEKELMENVDTVKLQIQRKNSALKQLGQKVAFLEGQKSRREHEHRSFFQNQRKMDDLLRKQKDKSMNAEIQNKRLQMEFQIYQKDKSAQISRLTRQLQTKIETPQRDLQTIKRLQEQIRMKDHKIQAFVEQIESLRNQITVRPVSPPPQDQNKKMLQELVKQVKSKTQVSAKENNEAIVRALFDKLGNRKDESLKNELSTLKAQLETIRRNSTVSQYPSNFQSDYKNRIRQLQKIIDDQKREKRSLIQQIQKLKSERDQIYQQSESHRRKVKQYKETQDKLLIEIEQLGNFKIQLQESKMENQQIKQKLESIIGLQGEPVRISPTVVHVKDIEGYKDQNRVLTRKIDQLTFALSRANEEKEFNQNILRQTQIKQLKRMTEDLQRLKNLLKGRQNQILVLSQKLKQEIQEKTKIKEDFIFRFQDLDKRNKQALESSRENYEDLMKAQVAKHYSELQMMNQKIIDLTKTNETFTTQGQYYLRIQKEVNELRRLTRTQKRTTEAVDHLWQIKQAEYGNINQILSSVRN